jgi:hypothetical protein
LSASLDFLDHQVTLKYILKEGSFSPKAISINGNPLPFINQENKYRLGGAVIPVDQFLGFLNQKENVVEITL